MSHRMSDEFATNDDTGFFSREMAAFAAHLDLKLDAFEDRLTAAFRHEVRAQTRIFVLSMVALVATMGSLAFVFI
ncbi:MAG TPA: hypothetical protein VFF07_07165 [Actinomycetota bacterium]|nr:hypothetical protein [Actinomycetota bacterium]